MVLSRKVSKFRAITFVLVLLIGCVADGVLGGEPSSGRLWPLPTTPSLSSSFGEFRDGHLHAGIDIRTGGKDGVPCRAVGDGYISRLRASPYGYGKALYLQLPNGETAVYAHLSEFAPAVETIVYEEQKRLGTYEIDTYLSADQLPVEEGDIIGYSGSTGGVAPHLHFEIRDAGEHPMNPLSHGWSLPDRLAPRFGRIVWIPLDKGARVDGFPFPKEVGTTKLEKGTFICRDTVSITGPVGLSARLMDRHHETSGRLLPRRVELFFEDKPITRIEMERFSFPQAGEVDLVYDMERAISRKQYYLNLFEKPGESVWNRWFQNGGLIPAGIDSFGTDTDPSVRHVFLRATDAQGNTSSLKVPYYVPAPESKPPVPEKAPVWETDELAGIFVYDDLLSVRLDTLEGEVLGRLFLATWLGGGDADTQDGLGRGSPHLGAAVDTRPATARFFCASVSDFDGSPIALPLKTTLGFQTVYLVPVKARAGKVQPIPDLGLCLDVLKHSLYGDGFVYLLKWEIPERSKPSQEELKLRSDVFRLGPLSLALRSFVEICLHLPDTLDGKESVYRLDQKKNEWEFVPTAIKEDSVRFQARRPGVYAVLSDSVSPRVATPTVHKHNMYAEGWAYPEIVIPIEDEGSGIDSEKTKILIDGKVMITRWDGVAKKMFVLIREKAIIGDRTLTVVAMDRVGNVSQLEENLTISEDQFDEPLKR